jgi:hypothetical protein
MAKARGAGPRPSVGKLTGKSGKGVTGGGKGTARMSAAFPANVVPTKPAESGDKDVVFERKAQAMQGTMLHKQLRKNKSTGMKP